VPSQGVVVLGDRLVGERCRVLRLIGHHHKVVDPPVCRVREVEGDELADPLVAALTILWNRTTFGAGLIRSRHRRSSTAARRCRR
jgi:hypothetical protein